MSIRELISEIKSNLEANTLDDYISDEFIWNKASNVASLLLKREVDNRKLFRNTSMFTKIECFAMKACSPTDMISEKELPSIYSSSFGGIIQLFNPTGSTAYKETTASMYRNIRNQEFKPRGTKYFYIEDNRIIIPNSEVESVNVLALISDVEAIAKIEGKCSVLDVTAPIPSYLLSSVVSQSVQALSLVKEIPKDENSNLNENIK